MTGYMVPGVGCCGVCGEDAASCAAGVKCFFIYYYELWCPRTCNYMKQEELFHGSLCGQRFVEHT